MALVTEVTLLDFIKTNTDNLEKSISFETSLSFTRPNTTTAYAINDIYNASETSVVLPEFDFTLANANKHFKVEQIFIVLSGNSTGTQTFTVRLYNSDTIVGQNLGDNQAYAPTFSEETLKSILIGLPSKINNGSNCYALAQYEMNRCIEIPSTGKVGLVLTTNVAITSVALQNVFVKLKGKYL